jgi:hypothetical protein
MAISPNGNTANGGTGKGAATPAGATPAGAPTGGTPARRRHLFHRRPGPRTPKVHKLGFDPYRRNYIWQFIRGTLFVQFLLFGTWNQSGYSYINWVTGGSHFTALMVVAGIALLTAHIVVLRIVYIALGPPGIIGAALLLGVVFLIASQLGLVELNELTGHVEFWLFAIASLLSIGIGWAKYQQRISGQRSVIKYYPP